MWVYIPYKDGYEIGYFLPSGKWICVFTIHDDVVEALGMVHYLNGGDVNRLPDNYFENGNCKHHLIDPAQGADL